MKTLASLILMASVCFGMGAETIESLHICKNSSDTYLVTISNNETEGRAIWIDHYDLLVGDYPSLLIPVQDKKSFKNVAEIKKFMGKHFGAGACMPISYDDVQKEIDRQTEEYTGQKVFR